MEETEGAQRQSRREPAENSREDGAERGGPAEAADDHAANLDELVAQYDREPAEEQLVEEWEEDQAREEAWIQHTIDECLAETSSTTRRW